MNNKNIVTLWMVTLIVMMPYVVSLNINNVQVVSITENSARITWSTDYVSEGSAMVGKSLTNAQKYGASGMTANHEVSISGLDSGSTYYYYVVANDGTTEKQSSSSSFITKMSAPTGLVVKETTEDSITVGWTSTASSFKLYFKKSGDANYKIAGTTSDHQYKITNLAADTEYSIKVAVVSQGSESTLSSPVTGQTAEKVAQINGLSVSGLAENTATISWTTSASVGCILYYGQNNPPTIAKPTSVGTTHSVSLSGLKSASSYNYYVDCAGVESSDRQFTTAGDDSTGDPGDTDTGDTDTGDTDTGDTDTGDGAQPAGSGETEFKDPENFLTVDAPQQTNSGEVTISGTTTGSAKLYIYVNNNNIAQIREEVSGEFSYEVKIDRTRKTNTIKGNHWINTAFSTTAIALTIRQLHIKVCI